jgi:hypothetical protein
MNERVTIADFSAADFVKVPTFPHPTQMSIMPVVAVRGPQLRLLGTCFAISNDGLVLTARHVLDAVFEAGQQPDGWQVGAMYIAEPMPGDDPAGLHGGFISANQIPRVGELDIGAMHLNLPARIDTGALLPMPALRLSPAIPRVGATCLALGYHDMKDEIARDNPYDHTIEQTYSASQGIIEEICFPRRDASMLTFPCFRTSLRHEPGMSGGPVVSEDGGVIGVVCSAIKGQDIYYVSLIGPALFLQLDGLGADGKAARMFLYDFVAGGAVGVDQTMRGLDIHRHGDTLQIHFGRPPALWGGLGGEVPRAAVQSP